MKKERPSLQTGGREEPLRREKEVAPQKATLRDGTVTWDYLAPGIPDELFCRDAAVPMTKEEIRCLSLSRLRLKPEHTLLDVGAGSGSVSIESALLLRQGRVIAVEKEKRALALLRQNAQRFGVSNLEIIEGAAPGALAGVGRADRIFIGGTGGRLPEILESCSALLVPGGVLVFNLLLLENLAAALHCLKGLPFGPPQVLSAALARGQPLGQKTMLVPLNPVFILSAQKEEGGP